MISKRVSAYREVRDQIEPACRQLKIAYKLATPPKKQLKQRGKVLKEWHQKLDGFDYISRKSQNCLDAEIKHYWRVLRNHVLKLHQEFGPIIIKQTSDVL